MYKDVTGIILSGGKSTRMGENKSLLKLGTLTAIERVTRLMKKIFEKVILITNTPDEYTFLNIPMFEDVYRYMGPLAGIHSGLLHSNTKENFVISCDIPLMTEEMIKFLVDYKTDKPVTVCRADGFVQQLAGRYSAFLLPQIEKSFLNEEKEIRTGEQKKRKCKVLSLLEKAGAEIINASDLEFYKEGIFFNMNRPEDYKKIRYLKFS